MLLPGPWGGVSASIGPATYACQDLRRIQQRYGTSWRDTAVILPSLKRQERAENW